MRTATVILVALGVCSMLCPAAADRSLLTPLGSTVGSGVVLLEYTSGTDAEHGSEYRVNLGLMDRLEVEYAGFRDFASQDSDAISFQYALMRKKDVEGNSGITDISIGIRDIGDDTDDKGSFYDGRSYYISALGGSTVLKKDGKAIGGLKLHAGLGTGSLSGVFLGATLAFTNRLMLQTEYDSEDINYGLRYFYGPGTINASSIRGDFYYGISFFMPLKGW